MEDKKIYRKQEYVIGHCTPIQNSVRVGNGLSEEWVLPLNKVLVLETEDGNIITPDEYGYYKTSKKFRVREIIKYEM